MRVLFAGTPEVALPVLRALLEADDHEVVGVVTRADARRGRGRALHPSPVADLARRAGLEVRTPASLNEEGLRDWVEQRRADVAVVVAYGRIVPPDVLGLTRHGWFNLHFSLLPAWRGAAPVQRAVMAGDTVTGASVFRLEEGLDTGPVYAEHTEPIGPRDTAGDLLARLAEAGAPLVLGVLSSLADGSAVPVPQADEGVSLAPRLHSADGRVDWSRPAVEIDRLIRAVTPAPGAHTDYRGHRLRLGPVEPVAAGQGQSPATPGRLRVSKHEVLVTTGDGFVRLGRVAPAGKSWMEAADWARGARPEALTVLGAARPAGAC